MNEPLWLSVKLVLSVHDAVLAEHGGASGIRDSGLLESALDRPRNRFAYEKPALPELAASYAFGLAKNHPFIDGNKRIAFMAAAIFLETNGYELTASEVDATLAILALAAGEMEEAAFAGWLKDNSRSRCG
jgi:death-on-curing protein